MPRVTAARFTVAVALLLLAGAAHAKVSDKPWRKRAVGWFRRRRQHGRALAPPPKKSLLPPPEKALMSPPPMSSPPPRPEAGAAKCPPTGFDSVKDFNLTAYIARPWYILKQIPLDYQPRNQLYCVRARYKPLNASNPRAGVQVFNYANADAVNGRAVGSSGPGQIPLVALPRPPPFVAPGGGRRALLQEGAAAAPVCPYRFGEGCPSSEASKLVVGPSFLSGQLFSQQCTTAFGPYWVVYYESDEYAIVSGGAPFYSGTNAKFCSTINKAPKPQPTTPAPPGPPAVDVQGGLWLFSRTPVVDASVVARLEAKAAALGLDVSEMVEVPQQGCLYTGAEP